MTCLPKTKLRGNKLFAVAVNFRLQIAAHFQQFYELPHHGHAPIEHDLLNWTSFEKLARSDAMVEVESRNVHEKVNLVSKPYHHQQVNKEVCRQLLYHQY